MFKKSNNISYSIFFIFINFLLTYYFHFYFFYMPNHKFTLKYDEFFKIVTKNFFELLNCNVITEYEILNLPKKADIIIIKNPDTKKLELFKYFKIFNIISFKSEKDKPSIKDFNDLFIYLTGFCNREKSANLNNTTITLITPDFTKSFKNLLNKHAILLQDGLYKFHNDLLNIYFIEINQLDINALRNRISLYLR
ncbi:MAG: hypothetical protein KatS3mg129_0603 [Leptospiraceae bacterium]|nr:MAG: hypothetical protein KatS3mg129_0603 [Leptospiraceae bacterium]